MAYRLSYCLKKSGGVGRGVKKYLRYVLDLREGEDGGAPLVLRRHHVALGDAHLVVLVYPAGRYAWTAGATSPAPEAAQAGQLSSESASEPSEGESSSSGGGS